MSDAHKDERAALADALFEAFPGVPAPVPGAWSRTWAEQADAILASDWLAARLDRERRDVAERIAQAIEALVVVAGQSNPGDPVRAGLIEGYRDSARITREEADR